MRALEFMKIDYIKIKQQAYAFPLFLCIAILFGLKTESIVPGFSILTALEYLMFCVSVFATTPFGACDRKDAGFLVLLPSEVKDRVMGRFLFGFSLLAASLAMAGAIVGIRALQGRKMPEEILMLGLIMISFTAILMVLQITFFYLFGENRAGQILSLVRIVPGMAMFFGMNALIGEIGDNPDEMPELMIWAANNLRLLGIAFVIAAVMITVGGVALCIKTTAKKDYS